MTRMLLVVCAGLYVALVVLALRPATDLVVAHAFFTQARRFVGDNPAGVAVRYAIWACPYILLAGLLVMTALARCGVISGRFALGAKGIALLMVTLILAPGFIVHYGLKEISHRPRPKAVAAFDGAEPFRPWYRFDGACRHDCSFPSGEMAVTTWTVAPASLVPPPWRGAAVALGLIFAAAAGGWRMALGAHFLSDVCAGALITIVTVLLTRALLRLSGEVRRG